MNSADSANSRVIFAPGTIIAGKYRVEKMLAEGGMGLVVAATHIHLDQAVALKFLRGDVSSEWDALARFTREAKAAAQLRSEYVAHVLDAGLTEDGTPYMAMEYLEGHSLARSLQAGGPLDVTSAVDFLIQACEGLAEAHARGIVHRDVKPYNLFLVERSPGWHVIKILDFGISKFAFSDPSNVVTGVIIGSPCYMSPEQLRSTATVDHRTDIWSLGATLYELLAGRAAFDASQTLPELVTAILDRCPPALHEVRPEVPRELSAVVTRCLSKDREARFASTGEVAMALLPFASPRSRVVAERAASMRPAFRLSESESEIASGMPVPAWNGFANHRDSHAGFEPDDSGSPPSPEPTSAPALRPELREVASDAPTALEMEPPAELPPDAQPAAMAHRSRTLRWVGVVTLAAAALVVFVTILVAAPQPRNQAVTISAARTAQVTAPAITRPEAPPAAETLTPLRQTLPASDLLELRVRAFPSSSHIIIDGTAVAENPFRGSYPKDGESHRITVRADGYETKTEDVTLAKDMVVDISLNRAASRSAGATSPAGSPARAAGATSPAASPARASRRPSPAPVAAAPAVVPAAQQTPIASAAVEVDSAGGRMPLRPIETKDPYAAP